MLSGGTGTGAVAWASDRAELTNSSDALEPPPEPSARHEPAGFLERGGLPPVCSPQTVPDPTAGAGCRGRYDLPSSSSRKISKNAIDVNGKTQKRDFSIKP
jgi:hypothetical protein